jgi:hypothetical protein
MLHNINRQRPEGLEFVGICLANEDKGEGAFIPYKQMNPEESSHQRIVYDIIGDLFVMSNKMQEDNLEND